MVPSLLLQPLLENAVGHGIEPLPQGGIVEVRGRLDDGVITLEVTNPKPSGAPPPLRRGHRMALDNIRQRLDLAFPGRATVEVDVAESRYMVRLRFPRAEDESAAPATAPRGAAALPS
jgi:two-component system sensor histidine kinase AlgZ